MHYVIISFFSFFFFLICFKFYFQFSLNMFLFTLFPSFFYLSTDSVHVLNKLINVTGSYVGTEIKEMIIK